ncbi:MAG TPA: PIN domain-containing protein [Myxococcaceae bacterium]|nr:PIN domain-containing protein [Myxococcaceae bacterium]
MILVDTSVWIEALRRDRPLQLEQLVDFDEIVTCLPILQEVLQGFRDERAFRVARDSMTALPTVESPLRQEIFEEAANLYRSARRSGLTVRSSVDCLIAACAIRNDLTVLHRDRDFPLLAKVSALQQRGV